MATKVTLISERSSSSFMNNINKELARIERYNGRVIDVHFQETTKSTVTEYSALIVYQE